jgi:hypothetical protein
MTKLETWIAIGLMALATSAGAAECDIVITQRAFNSSDTRSVADVYNRTRAAMCNEQWSDSGSFESSSNKLGISLLTSSYSFGLDSARNASSQQFAQARSKYCSMSDAEYRSLYASSTATTNPQYALEAWSKCVQAQAYGLFMQVTESRNFDSFDVRLIHRTGGGTPYKIFDVIADTDTTCRAGNTQINPSREAPFPIETAEYVFRCTKSPERSTRISLNTSEGAPVGVDISGTRLSQADLRQLETNVNTLQGRVQNLQQSNSNLESRLQALQGGLTIAQNVCDRNPQNQVNCNAKCPDDKKVVSGICILRASGGGLAPIQNFGLSPSTNEWHCLWSGSATRGETTAFCAPK